MLICKSSSVRRRILARMRRLVLIVPHWLSSPEEHSFLRGSLPALAQMAERGELFKLHPIPEETWKEDERKKHWRSTVTPEAAWLGLDPTKTVFQQGPLIVSALGADPPSNSVHLEASLLSFDEGKISLPSFQIPEDDLRRILEAGTRLNTRFLTLIPGERHINGLVWEEGSLDTGFTPLSVALSGKENFAQLLPEGDGETLFRRYIDDSVNLLSELEVNVRRVDEGLEPLNVLWPWGAGFRESVPNLALRRGEVAYVESKSFRMAGLTRLAGYRHGDRSTFGRGVNVQLGKLFQRVLTHSPNIVVLDAIADLRWAGRNEEIDWLTREIEKELLAPLLDRSQKEGVEVTLLAPTGQVSPEAGAGPGEGLALRFNSVLKRNNSVPFDERALEERTISKIAPWDLVANALA